VDILQHVGNFSPTAAQPQRLSNDVTAATRISTGAAIARRRV